MEEEKMSEKFSRGDDTFRVPNTNRTWFISHIPR